MPVVVRIKIAVRERVESVAGHNADVRDYEAWMMRGKVVMDGVRQQTIAVVQEDSKKRQERCSE